MNDLLQPVVLRLIAYVLSPLVAMIPAAYAGAVHWDAVNYVLTISFPGLVSAALGGLAASSAIFAKWGVK